jgi:hypothetical protein
MLHMSFAIATEAESAATHDLDEVADASGRHRLADEFGVGVFSALALAQSRFDRRG